MAFAPVINFLARNFISFQGVFYRPMVGSFAYSVRERALVPLRQSCVLYIHSPRKNWNSFTTPLWTTHVRTVSLSCETSNLLLWFTSRSVITSLLLFFLISDLPSCVKFGKCCSILGKTNSKLSFLNILCDILQMFQACPVLLILNDVLENSDDSIG